MELSPISPTGYTQTHQANDRFQAADSNEDGSISQTEFISALEAEGVDSAKIDQMFHKMDVNQDGQISEQEHRDAVAAMEERMQQLMGQNGMGGNEDVDGVKTLLASLQKDAMDADQQETLQSMLDQIKNGGNFDANMTESMALVNSMIPSVDTRA